MPDVMAEVSQETFESLAGPPSLGTKLRLDRHASTDHRLAPLARGGRLYLVTRRPPPEQLWLVAVLDQPMFDGSQWAAAQASDVAVTDITELRSKLQFSSGTGWTGWCDGCKATHSFETRTLTTEDATMLDRAAGIVDTGDHARAPIGLSGKRLGPLVDAIIDDPSSNEARGIYADQLLADNDVRGQFILIDIALAGPLSIRKRKQLAARRAHLLAGYSPIWWPYPTLALETQRGFLRAIRGKWKAIAALAPEPFDSEPVTEVGISELEAHDLSAFLAAPWLPRIHRLNVRGLPNEVAFATLASSPQLANLRGLNVSGNQLGATALSAIALPSVQSLSLTGNPIDDDGLERLRAWPQLANLHALYVSSCEIGERGLDRFLAGAPLDKLATLTLSHNRFGDAGVAVLVGRTEQLPALEHLELKDCAISSVAAQALATAFPKVRLDLRRNDLDPALAPANARMRV